MGGDHADSLTPLGKNHPRIPVILLRDCQLKSNKRCGYAG